MSAQEKYQLGFYPCIKMQNLWQLKHIFNFLIRFNNLAQDKNKLLKVNHYLSPTIEQKTRPRGFSFTLFLAAFLRLRRVQPDRHAPVYSAVSQVSPFLPYNVLILKIFILLFPLHFSPLINPSPRNRHTVAHVHESFSLFAQSLHPLTLPSTLRRPT